MDELTLMKEFRAERVTKEPESRAAIWGIVEARIEAAAEAGAVGRAPAERRGLLTRRRRILAFAGAMALAAITAGALVLSSGPTAQPAAAEVLHQTAVVAAAAARGEVQEAGAEVGAAEQGVRAEPGEHRHRDGVGGVHDRCSAMAGGP